jgi:hypothetical protein
MSHQARRSAGVSTATYGSTVNELTGPMRQAQPGVFTLNPNKYGYAVKQTADMTFVAADYLCPFTGQIQNIGIPLDAANPDAGPFLCEQSGDPEPRSRSNLPGAEATPAGIEPRCQRDAPRARCGSRMERCGYRRDACCFQQDINGLRMASALH